ncbi:uncharacterized protein LOC143191920 [Rhynchophorus ferrugineus]|uniref:uncharacterized protein LOC143191920 n=1 Tax=Rhynchophorus ferrugineus TaxID=354439 RepID=UPI003FCEA2E8
MKFVVIIFIFSINSCWGGNHTGALVVSSDDPEIDGSTVVIPVTQVNLSDSDIPTVPSNITTTSTIPTTTSTATTTKIITTSDSTPTTASQPPKHQSTASPYIDRKFDGPSFIGGMILSLGMMAIAFVALKFYKSRSEQNYHTL